MPDHRRIDIARPAALAILIGLLSLTPIAPAAADEALMLTLDQARVLRIARPAATVIIGNPSIADATIQDNQTLIITARGFGTTNLIVLDREGQPIADELLIVQASEETVVTVFKRSARETFSCAPLCESTLNVGDQSEAFDTINTQLQARQGLAQGGN